jgi:hypothetical protein
VDVLGEEVEWFEDGDDVEGERCIGRYMHSVAGAKAIVLPCGLESAASGTGASIRATEIRVTLHLRKTSTEFSYGPHQAGTKSERGPVFKGGNQRLSQRIYSTSFRKLFRKPNRP